MIKLVPYTPEKKNTWDEFVSKSKNGTFLFYRDYMEYHNDRFQDCSFLFFKKGKLVALLPGNKDGNSYYTHQGLTYGGLILSTNAGIKNVMEIFSLLNAELKKKGINEVIYKPVPYIYHQIPSQEDIYALFLLNSEKTGCNISSVVYLNDRVPLKNNRKSGIAKSMSNGVRITESDDYKGYWNILRHNLHEKYKAKPVHSLDEILKLKNRFPVNIRLFTAVHNSEIVAGTVVFQTRYVNRIQYIASTDIGRDLGSLDHLFGELLDNISDFAPVFDFGTSNEEMGKYLNKNLISQKEGFGGRGVVFETYKYFIP